jgi:uncharacterized protein
MNQAEIIKKTEAFVKEQLAGEGTGHDWWHIERIRNSAKTMHEQEGGDWFVVELALLLHDVGDYKVIGAEEDDYTIAENFMIQQAVQQEVIDHVMFIIKNMSYSKSLGRKNDDASIEFAIVQDADRLDAIGAIGIARAFAFGGSKSRPLYDPEYTLEVSDSTESYRAAHGSTFHHFEEKLLHIKDLLNTKTARNIAQKRDDFMRTFLTQFLDEWNGEK